MINSAFASTSQPIAVDTSISHALLTASPIVQLTLLILVGLSIVCWAVMFTKWQQFKRIRVANFPFKNRFWKTASFDALFDELDEHPDSNLARIFKPAYVELQRLADAQLKVSAVGQEKVHLSGIDNIERVLRNAIDEEVALLESKLTVLATTGSTGPFIGLFGTVWGIMNAFQKIGATGSANLAVVAPGISEALIATAIGLLAAIPAVIAYNHWNSQIRRMELEMNNFSSDFINIAKRNFFQGN